MRLGLGEGYQEASFFFDVVSALHVVWASRVTCESREGVLVGYERVVPGDVGTVVKLE